MSTLRLASLGSSFAAGPGIAPQTERFALRSGSNYAQLLSQKLGAQLTDLSVSSATLKNVVSEAQTKNGKTYAPQVEGLACDVDIVMLIGGGNDIGYIGDVMSDTLRASFWGSILAFFLPKRNEGPVMEAEELKERFVEIIDRVRGIAPKSRVYLVEYLTLFGGNTRAGIDVAVDEKQMQCHKDIAAKLSDACRMAAKAREECCTLVPVAEKSWGNDLGSDEPWVEGFSFWGVLRGKAPFHPNAKGMKAVADILLGVLKGDYQDLARVD
ncbi:hypothetical protein B7494_g7360 [Chlorociboria aeruginascens]|nr:hypothetical protein B7494_g7360 [Chlorociboria aeruginascens]